MRDPRENYPLRSSLIGFLNRLWQRLTGRAAPAQQLITELHLPTLQLQLTQLETHRPNFQLQPQESNVAMFPQTTHNPLGYTERPQPFLDSILSRFDHGPEFFRNMQHHGRGAEQTGREGAYQWWRQTGFAALPDPESFRNSSKLAGNSNLEIPEGFICAITREIMTVPVYDPNFPQQRYDRHAIERWLIDHTTNPCTRAPLTVSDLVADDDLKARIDEFVAKALQTSVAASTPRNG